MHRYFRNLKDATNGKNIEKGMLDQNAKIVAINFNSVDSAEDMTNKSTQTNKEKQELDFTGKSKKFTLDRTNAQFLKQAYTKLNIAKEPSSKNVFSHTGLYADGHIWHIPFSPS